MPELSTPLPSDALSRRDQKLREGMYDAQLLPGASYVWPDPTRIPPNHVVLDGAAYSRLQLANVFYRIGTTYGVGDGSTTFNVPNWTAFAPTGGVWIMRV